MGYRGKKGYKKSLVPIEIQGFLSGAVGGIRSEEGLSQEVSSHARQCRYVLQILTFSKSTFHHVSKGVDQFYRDKGRYKGQNQGGIRKNTALPFYPKERKL